jgi:hypothetical protein
MVESETYLAPVTLQQFISMHDRVMYLNNRMMLGGYARFHLFHRTLTSANLQLQGFKRVQSERRSNTYFNTYCINN